MCIRVLELRAEWEFLFFLAEFLLLRGTSVDALTAIPTSMWPSRRCPFLRGWGVTLRCTERAQERQTTETPSGLQTGRGIV